MSDNRKYYYLKLKENYFDEDAIVLLESMQDGILYSNILLKLYLKSLKNGGKLQLDENIPYTAQMIATITRQQVGTVERALQIFMKLGLVEPLPSGALYMSNIELLIGQSSTEGERKRRARLALQEQKALPKAGADKCPPYQADICPPEIEKEIEIEKERERELDTGQTARAAYGRYGNVFLSQSELDGLKADLPDKWNYYIDRLSCHIASSGKRYRSHAATIYKWGAGGRSQESPEKGHTRLLMQGGREFMKNEINAVLENMTTATPEPEDYTGEDGLLYCGKCRKPKEAYFAPDKAAIFGRDRHPAECDCQRAAREEREAAEKRRRHLDTVEELKRRGFTDPTMRDWTFENDNGRNPQAGIARRYVEHWEDMRADNIGCLFWGGVGTGKSYLAGCIANALMEKEIPVHMTNFALILNDLAASFENRNEYISRLCRYPLLILDDFGMERGTEYGLEQVFNVIDSRYRSGKPLIVTTNLTLDDLRNPEDTAHSRIYDRLLSMCVPVRFTGDNFRQEAAQRKMESMKKLITD